MSPSPIRVTQVVFDMEGGGLESVVATLARRYHGSSVVTSIITLSGREGRLGSTLRPVVDALVPFRPMRGVSMVLPLGLAQAIRATRPDVVHLHSGAWLKPALASRFAGVARVVYTEHGREHDDDDWSRWLDRRAAAMTSAVVAVSERLRNYLRDVVGIAGDIAVVENGVDTERFAPGDAAAARAKLGLPPDAFVVGSVGRLEAVKAYQRLIEAFATARKQAGARSMVLLLVGEGSARAELETRARELGVSDVVKFPGWIADPLEAYRCLDVFSLTSISEGMSISLLEAMSTGVTPVVMDVGANAELLGSELSGQVVPAGDVEGVARLVARAATDGTARLGALARARVVSRYSVERMVSEYERLYRGRPAATTR